jgi:photosystem II stability/assembly factor-like uncharacterized protein
MPIKKPYQKTETTPSKKSTRQKKMTSTVVKKSTVVAPSSDVFSENFDADCPAVPMYSLWGQDYEDEPILFGVGGAYKGYIVRWYVNALQKWKRSVVVGEFPCLYGIWGAQEEQLLIAVGSGIILRSETGGETWQRCSYQESATLFRVGFTGTLKKLWAVGERGVVVCSVDLGASWQRVKIPITENLISVYASGALVLIGASNGEFCVSSDEGQSWRVVASGVNFAINRIWDTSAELSAVTNKGYVLCSTNQGASWSSTKPQKSLSHFEGGCLVNGNLYAVGTDTSISYKPKGEAWTKIKLGVSSWDAFPASGSAYVSTEEGTVYQILGSRVIKLIPKDDFVAE